MYLNKQTVTIDNFVGQQQAIRNIKMLINNTPHGKMPPHMLLIGDSGCGKTTLSRAIYATLKTRDNSIRYIEAPTGRTVNSPENVKLQLAKSGDSPTLYFFDEVHQMKDATQEALYEPMTDGTLTTFVRQMYCLVLPPICVVAATTEPGKLLQPFANRFQHITLSHYGQDDVTNILLSHELVGGTLTTEGARAISQRSKFNPRMAHTNYNRVLAYANEQDIHTIDENVVQQALACWGVDELGLGELDWRYMRYLYEAVEAQGILNIAGMISADPKYLEDTVEPFLIRAGYLIRTRAGRRLTPEGIRIVSIKGS